MGFHRYQTSTKIATSYTRYGYLMDPEISPPPLVIGAKYSVQGQNSLLSVEDCEFMIEIVFTEPTLFLDETHDIHKNLINKLNIILKSRNCQHSQKLGQQVLMHFKNGQYTCRVSGFHMQLAHKISFELLQFINSNTKSFTRIPGIKYYCGLSLALTEPSVKRRKLENFFRWKLVSLLLSHSHAAVHVFLIKEILSALHELIPCV
ncbi:hypothetical protein VP01_1030g1 [Puccinia sorghi]|uniref:Uncharacterized protein n=1 Tax=Puccinia sorghi TaxID=27349 RepID=A0A0L6VUZ3_9BASI|nr:hypothetical protein VP01_1030g1 [Puccinia sorghi]